MCVTYSVFKTGNNDGDKDPILKYTTVYILGSLKLCLTKADRCIIDGDIPKGCRLIADAADREVGPTGHSEAAWASSSGAVGPWAAVHGEEVVMTVPFPSVHSAEAQTLAGGFQAVPTGARTSWGQQPPPHTLPETGKGHIPRSLLLAESSQKPGDKRA